MLILAGVTISIVINGGLFRQAQSAVISADISSAEETIQPEIVAKQIDKRNNTEGISKQDIIDAVNGTGVLQEINDTNITENEEGDAWILSGETLKGNVIHNIKIKKNIAGVEVLSTTTTPPLASENVEFTYSPSGWTNGNVVVAISTKVTGYTIQCSRDGNTWEEYQGEITYEENGAIYARLKDMSSGSVGEAATGNINNIDKLAPNSFTPKVTSTTNSMTLSGSTTDAAATGTNGSSGISKYYFSNDNGATWVPSGGQTGTSYTWNNLTQNTTYTLEMKAVDNVGNETITDAVTGATGTVAGLTTGNVTFTYTPSTWTNGSVVVKISTTVTGYTLQYSTDGNTYTTYPAAGITFTANGTIFARLTDGINVGDFATGNVTNIDKLAPGVSTVAVSAGTLGTNSWYTTNVTVKVTAGADAGGSGVQKTTYTLSGATTKAETTITSGSTFSITADGTTTVTCYTYDNAGNKSGAATLTVKKDATVPVITLSQNTVVTSPKTVTATITDATSGVSVKEWAYNSHTASYFASSGTTFTGSTFSCENNIICTVYAKDAAGNEAVKTITVSGITDWTFNTTSVSGYQMVWTGGETSIGGATNSLRRWSDIAKWYQGA